MKKYSVVLMLLLAGCLNTQTKSDLKRPDFSVAPVETATVNSTAASPVGSKSCCKKSVSFEKESEIPEDWLKPVDPSEPF